MEIDQGQWTKDTSKIVPINEIELKIFNAKLISTVLQSSSLLSNISKMKNYPFLFVCQDASVTLQKDYPAEPIAGRVT